MPQRQLANLGVQGRQVRRRRDSRWLAAENPGGSFKKLAFPQSDLIGVDVELLSQFRQRRLALEGSQSHFRLESRCVVPVHALRHDNS